MKIVQDLEFEYILLIACDSSLQLRSIDVDRVMVNAYLRGRLELFRKWLLSRPLQQKTRKEIENWEPET